MKKQHGTDHVYTPLEALRLILTQGMFSDAELQELLPHSEICQFGANEILITEGEVSDNRVYFLLSGSVSVYIQDKFILNLQNQGDSIGEMGLISSAPRSATVRTDRSSTLLVFHAAMNQTALQDSDYRLRYFLSRIFNSILTEKLRKTSNRAKLYEDMASQTRGLEAERISLEQDIAEYLEQISLYTHLVNSAKDTILITDTQGRVLNANSSLNESFGMETDLLVGTPLLDFLEPGTGNNIDWSGILEATQKGGLQLELTVRAPGGQTAPADCSISAVRDKDQNILAFSVILRNIKERRQLEELMDRQRHELEDAYGQIKEMDRVKSNFLNMVSHELRTPISSILAYAEMLKMEGMVDPEDRDSFIGVIHQEAEKLSLMVKKVLAISKMESGQMMFQFSENHLEETVRTQVAMLRPRAEKKQLKLSLATEELPTVVFDEENLSEAILQIVDNAIHYTDAGEVRVFVEQSEKDALIRVEDTGKGIEDSKVDELLENFGRGDPLNIGGHGLGLGLPLSYLIIRAHSGDLKLEGRPGGGTRVIIRLPLEQKKEYQAS